MFCSNYVGNVLKRNLYGTVPIIKEHLVNLMVRYFKDSLNINKFGSINYDEVIVEKMYFPNPKKYFFNEKCK